mmetsp:Transcript_12227/g.27702  ORF Transcript_12227/g.27702 Transcript_12227/m.27702 type:complete len:618 (+) Transcript_12227:119-1972(+)
MLLGRVSQAAVWLLYCLTHHELRAEALEDVGLPCVQSLGNCSASRCCVTAGFQCFEKDASYAECRRQCKPGENPKDEEERWRQTWSCRALTLNSSTSNSTQARSSSTTTAPPLAVAPCAAPAGNCLASLCCITPGLTCFEKDSTYAQCKRSCTRGMDASEPAEVRTPWSCTPLGNFTTTTTTTYESSDSKRLCAVDDGDCSKLKCCVSANVTCFEKDTTFAQCLSKCPNATNASEAAAVKNESKQSSLWTCRVLGKAEPIKSSRKVHWDGSNLTLSHYWNCDGQSCDAMTLKPWNASLYVAPAGYGPLNPNDFGGASYGEKLWLTGSASDALSAMLGNDTDCCGKEPKGVGGCGRCILISVDSAVAGWRALVMKKDRCPPDMAGCAGNKLHLGIAAPGFDLSSENVCGQRPNTGFQNSSESKLLGNWRKNCSSTTECIQQCKSLSKPYATGCKRFAQWGWTKLTPTGVKYKMVPCPPAFRRHIGSLFGTDGPAITSTTTTSTTTLTQDDTSTTADFTVVPSSGCYSNACGCPPDYKADWCNAGNAKVQGVCSQSKESCATCEGNTWCSTGEAAMLETHTETVVRRHAPRVYTAHIGRSQPGTATRMTVHSDGVLQPA